jgi:hypothetical protein
LFREPSLDLELARLIQHGIHVGEIRPDVEADQAAVILATAYFSTVLRWISAEPPPFSLSDQLSRMLDMVLRGLLADRPADPGTADQAARRAAGLAGAGG